MSRTRWYQLEFAVHLVSSVYPQFPAFVSLCRFSSSRVFPASPPSQRAFFVPKPEEFRSRLRPEHRGHVDSIKRRGQRLILSWTVARRLNLGTFRDSVEEFLGYNSRMYSYLFFVSHRRFIRSSSDSSCYRRAARLRGGSYVM